MSHRRASAAAVVAVALVAGASAQAPAPPTPLPDPPAVRRALVICGLPGDDEHRAMYAGAIEKIVKALVEKDGFAAKDVWVRFGTEPKDGDGPAVKGSRGLSTRENLAADVAELRKTLSAEDGLWVIVLGHGHHDGRRSHLNLPGPDLSDIELGKLFAGVNAKEQIFFQTTSSSGFFGKPLAAPGRVVITATEADQEVNETIFPLALAEILSDPPPVADRDKDGALSALELYLAVVANAMERYVADENISTEHAQLDDNGDGHGSEVQMDYLPPELGGRFGAEDKKDEKKAKGKEKAKPAEKTGPKPLGPKDDGYLSSRIRVDRPKPKPAETAADKGEAPKERPQ